MGARMADCQIQKVVAIGKKLRPTMAVVLEGPSRSLVLASLVKLNRPDGRCRGECRYAAAMRGRNHGSRITLKRIPLRGQRLPLVNIVQIVLSCTGYHLVTSKFLSVKGGIHAYLPTRTCGSCRLIAATHYAGWRNRSTFV